MSDGQPAEGSIGACGEQPGSNAARQDLEPDELDELDEFDEPDMLDGLISWAIARADAALDEICAYLAERPATRGWLGKYPGESSPFRGRGQDEACSALLRRLRSQRGWGRRPRGAVRPPRLRRLP